MVWSLSYSNRLHLTVVKEVTRIERWGELHPLLVYPIHCGSWMSQIYGKLKINE